MEYLCFGKKEDFRKLVKDEVLSVNYDWEKAFSLIPLDENIDFSANAFMKWFETSNWPWQCGCREYLYEHPEQRFSNKDNALAFMNRIKASYENGYQDCLYGKNEHYSVIDECVDFFVDYCSFLNLIDELMTNNFSNSITKLKAS